MQTLSWTFTLSDGMLLPSEDFGALDEMPWTPRAQPEVALLQAFPEFAQQPFPQHQVHAAPAQQPHHTASLQQGVARSAMPAAGWVGQQVASNANALPQWPAHATGQAFPVLPATLPPHMLPQQVLPPIARLDAARQQVGMPHCTMPRAALNTAANGTGSETDGGPSDADTMFPADNVSHAASPSKALERAAAPAGASEDKLMFTDVAFEGESGKWSCFWLGRHSGNAQPVVVVRTSGCAGSGPATSVCYHHVSSAPKICIMGDCMSLVVRAQLCALRGLRHIFVI